MSEVEKIVVRATSDTTLSDSRMKMSVCQFWALHCRFDLMRWLITPQRTR